MLPPSAEAGHVVFARRKFPSANISNTFLAFQLVVADTEEVGKNSDAVWKTPMKDIVWQALVASTQRKPSPAPHNR